MITLRWSTDRHHIQRRNWDAWLTFLPRGCAGTPAGGFEDRFALNEGRFPPRTVVPPHPLQGSQVITYVLEGSLTFQDSAGGAGVTCAGEFQRRTAVEGVRHRERNPSRSVPAHIFQIILPSWPADLIPECQPSTETRRFLVAQRRDVLCMVASPDGEHGSLIIRSSAHVYSAILDSGRHLAYELAPLCSAWVHIVTGSVRMGGVILSTGDGAGLTAENAVSLIAREDSEILLVGLAAPDPNSPNTGLG